MLHHILLWLCYIKLFLIGLPHFLNLLMVSFFKYKGKDFEWYMIVNRQYHLLNQRSNFYSVQVGKRVVLVFSQLLPLIQQIQV